MTTSSSTEAGALPTKATFSEEGVPHKQQFTEAELIEMGIAIGLKVGADIDLDRVTELIHAHRESVGLPKGQVVIEDSPMAVVRKCKGCTPGNALYGQHDINWLIPTLLMSEAIQQKTKYLLELCRHVGWMWMSNAVTVVTRRPTELHLMRRGDVRVLHNPKGMAVRYLDGNGLYALDGIRIPRSIGDVHIAGGALSRIDRVGVSQVMAVQNTEQRAALLKWIPPKLLAECLDRKVLDRDTIEVGGDYVLYSVDFGDGNIRNFLEMTCPSDGTVHHERVSKECTTVKQALMFRNFGKVTMEFVAPLAMT